MSKESNKDRALEALILTGSPQGAAARCGLNERTVRRYMQEPEFAKEYREARRAMVTTAVAKMQNASHQAVETLIANLSSDNPNASNKAAQLLVEGAIKGVEVEDILERLEALEANANQ